MNIAFCGHKDFIASNGIEAKIIEMLLMYARKEREVCCFNGGYGAFDCLAAHCVDKAKEKTGNIKNCLVVPYLSKKFNKECFDEIIYPPLEDVPPKWAICRRNEWMVDNSAVIICFVSCGFGGAAKTLRYAKSRDKLIINLFDSCK